MGPHYKYLSDPSNKVYFARQRGIQGGKKGAEPEPVQTSLAEVSLFHLIVVRQTVECSQH